MNLIGELQARGYSLRHEGGGNYRVIGHSGLIVKSDCWYHHSKGIGGSPKELLTQLKLSSPTISYYTTKKDLAFSKNLVTIEDGLRLAFDKNTRNVESYLIRERHIDAILVHQLIQRKLIFQDIYENACFAGYNENNQLKCLSIRVTSHYRQPQKLELKGSDKRFTFSLRSKYHNADLIISESPIDILSIACLENHKRHKGYFQTHKIALCGTNTKHISKRVEKLQPKKVWIVCDNDNTGQRLSSKLYSQLHQKYDLKIIQVEHGKDPNDELRFRKKNLIE